MNPFEQLEKYELNQEDISQLNSNLIIVEKRDWLYNLAHQFQLDCVEYVRNHRRLRIYIICNHPHCFTLGRGLQRNKDLAGIELIDFNPAMRERLSIPLFDIKRGGGLTFHYPGQLICYPVVSLGQKMDVYKVMNQLLGWAQGLLEQKYGLQNLSHKEKLLGLWWGDKKMASIGIAVSRFITYHGMAFNVLSDHVMNEQLQKVYPCGLPGSVYVSLQEALGREDVYEKFWQLFKETLIQDQLNALGYSADL